MKFVWRSPFFILLQAPDGASGVLCMLPALESTERVTHEVQCRVALWEGRAAQLEAVYLK